MMPIRTTAVALPTLIVAMDAAARAAEAAGDRGKAKMYYTRLIELTKGADSERSEVVARAKAFVAAN
jgi:hypothetical protein